MKRLDALSEKQLDEESRAFLHQMRAVHARNIERCDGLIAELAPGAGVSREAGHDPHERGVTP